MVKQTNFHESFKLKFNVHVHVEYARKKTAYEKKFWMNWNVWAALARPATACPLNIIKEIKHIKGEDTFPASCNYILILDTWLILHLIRLFRLIKESEKHKRKLAITKKFSDMAIGESPMVIPVIRKELLSEQTNRKLWRVWANVEWWKPSDITWLLLTINLNWAQIGRTPLRYWTKFNQLIQERRGEGR